MKDVEVSTFINSLIFRNVENLHTYCNSSHYLQLHMDLKFHVLNSESLISDVFYPKRAIYYCIATLLLWTVTAHLFDMF